MTDRLLHLKRAAHAVLLVLLLSAVGMTNAMAQTFTVGNLNYSINEDGATVTVTGHVDGENASGELVIPDSVEVYGGTYPVTVIGTDAFRAYSSITSVIIGNSVTDIQSEAFYYCTGLTSLVIGNSVTQIGGYAFGTCRQLTSVTIPESVTYLSYCSFANCSNLVTLNYNAVSCYYVRPDNHWLTGCTSLTNLNIGENVMVIPDGFVNGFSSLTGTLTLPNTVTYIGNDAFNSCSGFTGSLIIPNSVNSIGAGAFSSCTGLSGTLSIGNSVSQIGNTAFFGSCENFTSMNVWPENPPTLGNNVFISANYGIPVQVPCGSLDAYSNASGWDVFTNFQEPDPCLWDIMATANPAEGGTISGAGTYEQGSTCTLTATPNEGITFVNWTEDGVEVSTDAEYSFTVEGNRSLVANFVIPTYFITVTANPNDAGTITSNSTIFDFEDGQIPPGWNNNLSNYPWTVTAQGYNGSFSMRSSNGGVSSSTSAIEATVDFVADGSISFMALCMGEGTSTAWDKCEFFIDGVQQFSYGANMPGWNRYTYDVPAGTHTFKWSYSKDSTVNPTGDAFFVDDVSFGHVYHYGDICTLTATPNSENYVFVNWTEDGEVVSSNAQYSFTVTGNRSLVANFVQVRFDITASANPEEGGTIEGTGNYMVGQTCTLTATPNEDYAFVNWTTENGEEVSTNEEYAFTVASDRYLVANFRYVRCEITATANPAEGGTISGIGSYLEGETCTLTAIPNQDCTFINWTENGEEVSTDLEYSFVVTGSRDLVANFELPTYTITTTPNPIEGGVVSFGQGSGLYDFEDGTLQGWTTIDADGDGYTWRTATSVMSGSFYGHNDSYDFILSQSYYSGTILYPDNYLVSPLVQLGGSITFYACAQDASYAAEHFGVAVSTNSNNNPNDFTTIQEWTMTAKGVGAPTDVTRSGNRAQGNWYEYTVDLSDYAGQSGYVALRHFNCSDMFYLDVDDITISQPDGLTFTMGSICTLTATPFYGYALESWTENGNVVSTDAEYSFTVTGDRNLVANFVKVPFSITVTPNFEDWGTVSGVGEYVLDSVCTLTAMPAEGHSFLHWLENGELVSTEAEYTFTVAGPRDLVAVFSPLEGTYIVFADPNVEAICVNNWDTDGDGFLSYDEAAAVTDLGNVFRNNRNITSFDELQYFIGLTFINDYDFYYCQNLTSIVIPENVTSIGYEAFLYCNNLGGTLTINENVTYIGWGAFYYTNFSTLNYNAVNCEMGGQWLDAATSSLTSLNIGENVEVIPYRAFRNCYNVTGELVIPNSVTYIGAYAFQGCSGFTSITIPEGITSIEEWTFDGCSSAETINLPSTLESIGNGAFQYCSSLTNIAIPSTVHTIGGGAFGYCSSLSGTLEIPALVTSIENGTFRDCSSLTGLVLPENLQYIGYTAFQNCSGLRGEITLPETLESVGGYAFYGCDGISTVNYNAINCTTMGSAGEPVFYDCAFSHLRIGENVESIPDFAFKRCFLITDISTAAINPPTIYSSTFGMVSRSIPVHVPVGSGEAYRNAPYWEEFFNITEDYSPSQYSCHWSANPNQFEGNMTVIGIIQIDGEEQTTDALEIGAFSGEECRGSQMLAYYPEVNRYLVFLTLYGEAGDLLTFRLYDHAAGEESVLGCESYVTFETDGRLGTLAEPYPFNFTSIQVTTLPQGWKWWSGYVELDEGSLAQMEESLGENGLLIKSRDDGFVSNYESIWYGSLTTVNNENTYLIKTAAPCVMTVAGEMTQASAHPITLPSGWSWIGYPSNRPMSVNTALAGLEAEDDDMLKSQEGFCVYYPEMGWVGTLHTLTPGMGLMYESHSATSQTFAYSAPDRAETLEKNVTARGNHWEPDHAAYPDNMSVIAVVELDGEELQGGDYELAAFAGSECRGSVKLMPMEATGLYMAFLTVFGDEPTDLRFGLYDSATGMEIVGSDENAVFAANAVMGSLKEPYVVRFRGTTGMDEWANRLNAYPNPAASGETFSITLPMEDRGKVCVEIINALGQVVEARRGMSLQDVRVPAAAGVYTLRISVEGKGVCNKKLVVR